MKLQVLFAVIAAALLAQTPRPAPAKPPAAPKPASVRKPIPAAPPSVAANPKNWKFKTLFETGQVIAGLKFLRYTYYALNNNGDIAFVGIYDDPDGRPGQAVVHNNQIVDKAKEIGQLALLDNGQVVYKKNNVFYSNGKPLLEGPPECQSSYELMPYHRPGVKLLFRGGGGDCPYPQYFRLDPATAKAEALPPFDRTNFGDKVVTSALGIGNGINTAGEAPFRAQYGSQEGIFTNLRFVSDVPKENDFLGLSIAENGDVYYATSYFYQDKGQFGLHYWRNGQRVADLARVNGNTGFLQANSRGTGVLMAENREPVTFNPAMPPEDYAELMRHGDRWASLGTPLLNENSEILWPLIAEKSSSLVIATPTMPPVSLGNLAPPAPPTPQVKGLTSSLYNFRIVAETGTKIGPHILNGLDANRFVSADINDQGEVAYLGRVRVGDSYGYALFRDQELLLTEGQTLPNGTLQLLGNPDINNAGQVAVAIEMRGPRRCTECGSGIWVDGKTSQWNPDGALREGGKLVWINDKGDLLTVDRSMPAINGVPIDWKIPADQERYANGNLVSWNEEGETAMVTTGNPPDLRTGKRRISLSLAISRMNLFNIQQAWINTKGQVMLRAFVKLAGESLFSLERNLGPFSGAPQLTDSGHIYRLSQVSNWVQRIDYETGTVTEIARPEMQVGEGRVIESILSSPRANNLGEVVFVVKFANGNQALVVAEPKGRIQRPPRPAQVVTSSAVPRPAAATAPPPSAETVSVASTPSVPQPITTPPVTPAPVAPTPVPPAPVAEAPPTASLPAVTKRSGALEWTGAAGPEAVLTFDGTLGGGWSGDPLPGQPVMLRVEPATVVVSRAPSSGTQFRSFALRQPKRAATKIRVSWELVGQ